ncbi:NUMOD3 domain-containing DNA-binding protein [Mesorhizobium sp. M1A.F.Ca.ET.072.01.1.1]|uniref:NUMOD3 domain-containing DNA-binding protein n=1 Tax=Mesorhizobium sp. M1A.F.Ca.ET.072.01.1.1 TaxID=2496753 RepID=UPI0016736E17|nr:NUMOD3 domain-containing DNA-binding protein [Mesorhizobium sp. M1A.F.Ca.ET.072.01.1.1]
MTTDRCVYLHITPDTGRVFYVGIGTKRRAFQCSTRNHKWKRVVEKHGKPQVMIIADGLSIDHAVELEKFWIRHHGLHRLANISPGGDGVSGAGHSAETRKKLSLLMKGRDKGKRLSDDHKRKISASCIGRKPSQETREKIRNTLSGRKIPEDVIARMNIRGRVRSESELEKLRQANASKTIHHFKHDEHGDVFSTAYELRKRYNLSDSALSAVIKRKRRIHKGWTINLGHPTTTP